MPYKVCSNDDPRIELDSISPCSIQKTFSRKVIFLFFNQNIGCGY